MEPLFSRYLLICLNQTRNKAVAIGLSSNAQRDIQGKLGTISKKEGGQSHVSLLYHLLLVIGKDEKNLLERYGPQRVMQFQHLHDLLSNTLSFEEYHSGLDSSFGTIQFEDISDMTELKEQAQTLANTLFAMIDNARIPILVEEERYHSDSPEQMYAQLEPLYLKNKLNKLPKATIEQTPTPKVRL